MEEFDEAFHEIFPSPVERIAPQEAPVREQTPERWELGRRVTRYVGQGCDCLSAWGRSLRSAPRAYCPSPRLSFLKTDLSSVPAKRCPCAHG